REHHFARRALDLRQLFSQLRQVFPEKRGIAPRLGDEAGDAAVLLAQKREQQVLGLDVLLIPTQGQALGFGERLLQLGGEFVESHRVDPVGYSVSPVTQMGATLGTFKAKLPRLPNSRSDPTSWRWNEKRSSTSAI